MGRTGHLQRNTLRDHVAIVTGGGRGVGRAISLALAGAGAAVAVASRTEAELDAVTAEISAAGGTAVAVPTDVTRWADVETLVRRVEDVFGPVDLLVNNAGGAHAIGPIWELPPDEWWSDVALNLQAAVWGTRAVLPSMVARRSGRVINVASMLGTRPDPYQSAYVTAKAGLILFTECTALAVRDHGVGVFAISPGLVRTTTFDDAVNGEAGRRWLPELGNLPPDRFTPPERAGELAVFLAEGRGDTLAGRFLHVRDDETELVASAAKIVEQDLLALRLRR